MAKTKAITKNMKHIRYLSGSGDDTKWEIYFQLPRDPNTGKRHNKTMRFVGSVKEVQAERDRQQVEMNEADAPALVSATSMTVGDAMNKWFTMFTADLQPKTRAGYRKLIDGRLMQDFGHIKVSKLTFDTIQNAVNRWQVEGKMKPLRPAADGTVQTVEIEGGISARSIKANIIVLSMVLDKCCRPWKYLRENPCKTLVLPKFGKKHESERKTYTWAELKRLFAQVDLSTEKCQTTFNGLRLKAVAHLAACYGLRIGEVFGLSFKGIDFDARSMHISQVVSSPAGQPAYLKMVPKNSESDRYIAFDDYTHFLLLSLWNAYDKMQKKFISFDVDGLQLVFGDPNTGGVYDPGNYNCRFKRLTKAAGLPHITLHDLRHTHATLLNELRVSYDDRRKRLGHADPSMTGHYTHISPVIQIEESRAITDVFAPVYLARVMGIAA
jgi:integrase